MGNMVGICYLLKIGEMAGIHHIVKKLVRQLVSTAYSKIGNMVGIHCLFKIGEMVGICCLVKIGETVGICRLVKIGETVGIHCIFKNWHCGGYPQPTVKFNRTLDKQAWCISTVHCEFEVDSRFPPWALKL